ncbi:hypothetical protein B4O97_15975 [Marispirochaeta aestuarii]|uniref:Peptidase S8/S53 domain-containing protein n=1 Tax=Marispirochaeta aestuarii TaxID=1963862 RepID=A0A1Y1RVS4_9SPIO|nr:S8 family peptidase [Marispirochaeta aestuarii]ORC32656.1 hypothetical protein B4O97_15975 [Marispirochaeta aestuarii]
MINTRYSTVITYLFFFIEFFYFISCSLDSDKIESDVLTDTSSYTLSGTWFSKFLDNFVPVSDSPGVDFDPYNGPVYNPDIDSTPDDTLYNEQWNLQHLEMPAVWASVTGDPSVVVAVLDTGINQELPDFNGVNFVTGRNIVDNNGDTSDSIGHGTHVAGTIAQATNNAFGTAGMAFGVSLMPVKVIQNDMMSSSDLIAQGIDWAASNGADIINLSIGDPEAVTPEGMEGLHTAIQNAVSMGVTIVAAAGNNNDSVRYPAAFEEVVAVGAVDFAGNRTEYSNYGPELDVVAPGGGSTANVVGDGLRDAILQHTVIYVPLPAVQYGNEDFWYLAGTSQAAPHVSALAALLKSAQPSLSPAEIRAAMENTAVDLGEPYTDPYYGKGLIDPVAALSFGINLYENITGFAARRIEEGSFSHCWQIHADAGVMEISLEIPENEAGIGMYLYNIAGRLVSVGAPLPGSESISFDVKLQGGVYYVIVRRDL